MGYWKPVGIVLLAVLLVKIVKVLLFLDITKTIHSHHPGPCHLVAGVVDGSEDLEMVDEQRALISSGLRFSQRDVELFPERRGQILVFDFITPLNGVQPVTLQGVDVTTFNPHGISIWRDHESGDTRVFVVNHPVNASFDEVLILRYDASKMTLRLLQTIRDDSFRTLNDIVATGEESFYVTNCLYARGDTPRILESVLMLSWGQLIYYNGKNGTPVVDNLLEPNGIAISPDGRYVYVAAYGEGSLHVYDRDSQGSLTLKRIHPLDTHPDNIDVDAETGDLWIGAHPIQHMLIAHADAPLEQPSPSQVLHLKMSDGDVEYTEEVFADAGRDLYGSSVAVYKAGRMLIGTVYQKLMICEVRHLGLEIR